jgi:hypothetical protein
MFLIRVVLSLTTNLNLEVEQLDVKTNFLHGDLDEEIYMEKYEGFKVKKKALSLQAKKSLYGLKQTLMKWYNTFDSFMVEHGYGRTTSDHYVFIKRYLDGNFIFFYMWMMY